MAVVTTTIVPELTFFPWQDRGQNMGKGLAPVGEIIANSRDAAITLSGAGDTQEARWVITLPPNNSYVMIDYSATINIGAAANTWETVQSLVFFDTTLLGPQTFEWGVGLVTDGESSLPGTINKAKVWRPASPLPTFQQNAGGLWQTTLVDLTAEEPAANLNATARFLVYTIDQQYDAAVNTPQLIR